MNNATIFIGRGGQGIISMGIMLAQCGIDSGKHAAYMPSYGPEQRGGSAKCTVLIDKDEIISPMAEYCSVLVAMDSTAYEKYGYELESGGLLIYDSNSISGEEIKRGDIEKIAVPASDIALSIGAPRAANIVIMGVLVGRTHMVSEESYAASIERKFAKKSDEVRRLNALAFKKGLELCK